MKLLLLILIISCQECLTKKKSSKYEHSVRYHIFTLDKNQTIDLVHNIDVNISGICNPKTRSDYKLITHGFAETWNMTFRWNWVQEMIEEMLKSNQAKSLCIIAVDWAELAKGAKLTMNYWKAIENMKVTAEIMSIYSDKMKMNEKKFHCIGFSLGAHMCSIFYKTYFEMYKRKPFRITGLDPAGPFFSSKNTSEKLHHTDADLVDIIHTSDNFGLDEKNGHMDFYPDLGDINACNEVKQRFDNLENVILYEETTTNKKGVEYKEIQLNNLTEIDTLSVENLKKKLNSLFCKVKDFFSNKPKRVFISLHQFFGCSHLMSVRYFIYSINKCDYKSHMCNKKQDFEMKKCLDNSNSYDFARMGYHTERSNNKYLTSYGNFYLNTTNKPPYCDPSQNYKPGFFRSLWNKIIG
ncbi:unnamed protein product [Brachionus calyciflorus]|uniref:Lipase domain-containing protein n=1 Tax=Brachionus calyciflorus TaxID=104777 RepID=A0A814IT91_9BILA|nr:unnamed protein product [Brachionus calyciflorus]